MDCETGTELRLEPCGLRRHDVAAVGDVGELLHGNRIKRESDLHLTIVHAAGKLAETTDSTYEINAFVRTEILDTQNLVKNQIRKDRHIEDADRVLVIISSGLCLKRVPLALQIHGEVMKMGRTIFAFAVIRLHVEILAESLDELLWRKTIEILDHAVVIDNLQLAFREADRHEIIILFLACMVRITFSLFSTDTCSSSCTMVTVSHIESIDLGREDLRDAGNHCIVIDYPESMTEAILICKRILRLSGSSFCHYFIELRIVLIREEYRLDIGILDFHMNHAVILLVLAGKLMLFDLAVGIVVSMGAKHQTVLCSSVHGLGIDIIARLAILNEPFFLLPLGKILHSLVIYTAVVIRKYRIEINLRLGYMKQGFLACHVLRLF